MVLLELTISPPYNDRFSHLHRLQRIMQLCLTGVEMLNNNLEIHALKSAWEKP